MFGDLISVLSKMFHIIIMQVMEKKLLGRYRIPHFSKKLNLIMRLTVILTLFLTFSLSAKVLSQDKSLTLNLESENLSSALTEVMNATGVQILFNENILKKVKCEKMEFNKIPVLDALNKLLNKTGFECKKIDDVFIIKKSKNLEQQETYKVSGKVIDVNGNSLPGVTVLIKGTSFGVATDIDGKYKISLKSKNVVLLFSFIGMKSKEVVFNGQEIINVVLKENTEQMNEVVVTGYQTISKERATGSFGIVNTKQLEKPAASIAERLVGTTAGVQTTIDEDGDIVFQIRGKSSLNSDAQPLVVVDGFPIQGKFSSINPNDVASVTILKDAAAASIWGAKSANGVIVVTTKSGRNIEKGSMKVQFSSFWKFSPMMDLDYYNPVASSAECIDYEKRGFSDGTFFGQLFRPNSDNAYSIDGNYSQAVTAINENRLGYLSDEELESTLSQLATQNNKEQIKDYLMENPFTHQYNLTISGASENMNHSLSIMYEGHNGNWKGHDRKKYNVSYRAMTKIYDWLDFTFAGNVNYIDQENNGFTNRTYYYEDYYDDEGTVAEWSPYQMLVNEDGSYAMFDKIYMPNVERYVPTENFTYSEWGYNPIQEMKSKDFTTTTLDYRIQGGLSLKIIDGLKIDTKLQYERINTDTKNIQDETSYKVRYTVNSNSDWNRATNEVTANLPSGGILEQSKTVVKYYNWRNQISYNKNFNDLKHQISFIGGTEISDKISEGTNYAKTYGYDDDKLTVGTFPNGVGGSGVLAIKEMSGWPITFSYTDSFTYSEDRYFSAFGNLSYTYDQKYTLSGSYRTDASNLITDDPSYRYSPFWSVGASWNIGKENFALAQSTWLDRLIVRFTYGYNGNVDKSTSFKPLISVNGTKNSYIQAHTASISSFGNPDLRWEKTRTLDFGVDYAMLGGKLTAKIDYYNKKGKDLIVATAMSSVNGTSSQKINAATMTNKGIEMELGTSLKINGDDITFTGGVNFSYNKNNIDKLFKTTYAAYELYAGGTSSYVQGHNANTLWSFEYNGLINKGTESNPIMKPSVKGVDGEAYDFGGWTPGDGRDYMLDMGTTVAPCSYGINGSFKIYDFNLSFIFTGKFGHKFNGYQFNYPAMTSGNALPNTLYEETLNADPSEVVPIPFDGESRYYFWDRFIPYMNYRVQKAGHFRCQEISISYNVPTIVLNKIGIKGASVYAQGNNLFIITNNKYNEDPEHPKGTENLQASYTFGINLTF